MAKPLNSDIDLSVSQILGAWRIMCGRPGVTANGVDYIFSGVPVAFFNVAVLTARDVSADALQATGTAACAWALTRPCRGCSWSPMKRSPRELTPLRLSSAAISRR